jgi:thiol-disulfide isomerase/thioredoxin
MRRALGRVGGAALWLAVSACRPTTPSPPSGGFTLLFFGHSPSAALAGRFWVAVPDSNFLVAFDSALHVTRVVSNTRLNTPVAVAPWRGRLLVSELMGDAVVLDTSGRWLRDWEGPFAVSIYAGGGAGDRVVAARSPYQVRPFTPDSFTAPLVRVLDSAGRPIGGLGAIHRPGIQFLIGPTNAGALAADSSGAFYFAPLARDEIAKYDAAGRRLWTTTRGLPARGRDPVFGPAQGRTLPLVLAVVNVGLAIGPPPGGRLYALGSEDSAATRLRVDVLDTATGRILETRRLAARQTAVAVDARGALALFDADSLLATAMPTGRQPFTPAFALPDLRGDTVPLARFAGRVTLVNVWASWCDPCREEFPHMAALYREFDRKDFEIAAISDDVDARKMRAFVAQFRPPFPVLVGGGRMKAAYHYRGLPYSVLLDRRGRVIERIYGFGGAAEFQQLHDMIAKEVGAP